MDAEGNGLYTSIMAEAMPVGELRAADVEVGLAEARTRLGELVNRAHGGEVIYLTRNGVPLAALLPVEELRRLVEAEEDLEDLRAVLASDREGGETIPWETLKAELGL